MQGNNSKSILLSLCIPTNGVAAWVEPVLRSIYCQEVSEDFFEVIVSDNGDNKAFYAMMKKWCNEHKNIRYYKNKTQGFLNQIECFRKANGKYIKFINHRMTLKMGTLQHLLNFVIDNHKVKPICYFLNGNLPLTTWSKYEDFDSFVRALSYYSSWSAGLGIWRDDFINMPNELKYNTLFPHTSILFKSYKNRFYLIDNETLMESLPEDHHKGRYNLFYAFAVEYPSIIVDMLRRGEITFETVMRVKNDLLNFLAILYFNYIILRRECSYDLTDVNINVRLYYSRWKLWRQLLVYIARRLVRKLCHIFNDNKKRCIYFFMAIYR